MIGERCTSQTVYRRDERMARHFMSACNDLILPLLPQGDGIINPCDSLCVHVAQS
jgi:hypothetical protein